MTELKESLPRSGHVTEVCKEWLVREDGALAYQLQSKEINEFYNGNRFRNAVVRQDFPTALHEQVKEHETAAKQAELHQRRLMEQERADAELAKQIADRLERERERERLRECSEGETVARLLQRAYIDTAQVKPHHDYPIPSASSNLPHRNQTHFQQHTDVANVRATRDFDMHEPKIPPALPQEQRQQQKFVRSPTNSIPPPPLPQGFENIHNAAYKPLPPLPPPARNALPAKRIPPIPQNISPSTSLSHGQRQPVANGHSMLHSDSVVESILQYNLNDSTPPDQRTPSTSRSNSNQRPHQLQLSPEKYDYIMQNLHLNKLDELVFPEDLQTIDDSRPNITSNGMRSNKPALANIKNVSALKDLGIPPEEVIELDRKLEQEKRDEELAVRLQKEEARESLTQEERDRLLAIEAQDKELAKMLQERERAKARRAREKARLKKMQARPQSDVEGHSYSQRSPGSSQLPRPSDILMDGDSYSNPVDLLGSGHSSLDSSYRHERMSSSVSADHANLTLKDDEIYTLPVEDELSETKRPNSLALADESHKRHTKGDQSPETIGNIAAVIDPTYTSQNTGTYNSTMSSPLGYNLNNAPPYMPIQGTRRSASLDAKKKKSKDKCSHQ